MTYREHDLADEPLDEEDVLDDPVAEDVAIGTLGEEVDPDSVRPMRLPVDEDELPLDDDDDEVRRGL
ncbi:MAG TPA: hypothetical protein VM450_19705 [Thermomicrobiales bacterium]|jgi:hypothetical protein|nr:hypothetical protein [Thermomicrobiales bacterium]